MAVITRICLMVWQTIIFFVWIFFALWTSRVFKVRLNFCLHPGLFLSLGLSGLSRYVMIWSWITWNCYTICGESLWSSRSNQHMMQSSDGFWNVAAVRTYFNIYITRHTHTLTAVLLIGSVLAVRVSVAVPVLCDTAAVCAAELLVRTFTHVWQGKKNTTAYV